MIFSELRISPGCSFTQFSSLPLSVSVNCVTPNDYTEHWNTTLQFHLTKWLLILYAEGKTI